MGFYSPEQLVLDAREHDVAVKPIDVNHSYWDNVLEEKAGKYFVLRLGFRQVLELKQKDVDVLIAGRVSSYKNINELRGAGVSQSALELLAGADAFNSMNFDRRKALWQASTKDIPFAIFKGQSSPDEKGENISLPEMLTSEHLVEDYEATTLSLRPIFPRYENDRLENKTSSPVKSPVVSFDNLEVSQLNRLVSRDSPENNRKRSVKTMFGFRSFTRN